MTIGERIAALRRERGWSQAQLAAALAAASGRGTLTREEVSRWERGRRVPTPYWVSHLAAVLSVPPEALRPAVPASFPPGEANAALAEALDWLLSDPPQVTARRAGRRVGAELAAEVADRAARLRHLDDTLPGRELVPVAAAEFAATAALARDASCTGTTRRSLLASLGETGQVLGWIEADLGQNQAAQAHYQAGFAAAREAGDTAGAANNASCLAYLWTTAGSPREGRLLAAAALRGAARHVPPLAAALLHERLAYASALAGDAQATGQTLGPVHDLIEAGTAARDDEPEWTYWLTHDEADVMAARCATRLGQAGTAVPLIHAALSRYDPAHTRELALYWSFLAEAHLRAGQRAEAADALAAAAAHAEGTSSARVTSRLETLRRALADQQPS